MAGQSWAHLSSELEPNMTANINNHHHSFQDASPKLSTASHEATPSQHNALRSEQEKSIRKLIGEIARSSERLESQKTLDPDPGLANSRWASLSRQIVDTLDGPISWASEIGFEDLCGNPNSRPTADVWRLTTDELQTLIDRGYPLDATIVIRGVSNTATADFNDFLSALKTYSYVDVQDLSRQPHQVVVRMPTATVVKRVKKSLDRVTDSSLPLNLLNMENISGLYDRVAPPFLRNPRFTLLSEVCSRLRDRLPTSGPFSRNPGKRDFIEACEQFSIFAQRGAFSGPHCDALVGTWVHNVRGLKAWPIIPNLTEAEAAEYETKGSFWQPSTTTPKMIVLGEGDTIIMPAGKTIIHCPLTLEDCYMVGGMFWDVKAVLEILLGVWWTAKAPVITNEPLSRQLPEVLTILRQMIVDDPERFTATCRGRFRVSDYLHLFDSRVEAIRSEGSCQCCSSGERCRCRWDACKCKLYRDKCNSWCRARKAAAREELLRRKRQRVTDEQLLRSDVEVVEGQLMRTFDDVASVPWQQSSCPQSVSVKLCSDPRQKIQKARTELRKRVQSGSENALLSYPGSGLRSDVDEAATGAVVYSAAREAPRTSPTPLSGIAHTPGCDNFALIGESEASSVSSLSEFTPEPPMLHLYETSPTHDPSESATSVVTVDTPGTDVSSFIDTSPPEKFAGAIFVNETEKSLKAKIQYSKRRRLVDEDGHRASLPA